MPVAKRNRGSTPRLRLETERGVIVIELSVDGGDTWADVTTLGFAGYNGSIAVNPDNPAGGRVGFVNQNADWPAFSALTLDFGLQFAGQTVMLRFGVATDLYVGAYGWDIDSLQVSGLAELPFRDRVDDTAACHLLAKEAVYLVDFLLQSAALAADSGDTALARRRVGEARNGASLSQEQASAVLLARLGPPGETVYGLPLPQFLTHPNDARAAIVIMSVFTIGEGFLLFLVAIRVFVFARTQARQNACMPPRPNASHAGFPR